VTLALPRLAALSLSCATLVSVTGCGVAATPLAGVVAADCEALGAALQASLDAAVKTQKLPGVAAAVDAGGCQVRLASGVSSESTRARLEPGALFRVGSITKSFVATLALMLRAEGKLSLDAPVSTYVNGVPGGDRMTLRQVLNHTSGLFDYTESDAFWAAAGAAPTRRWAPPELIAFAAAGKPYFAPGEGFQYSNTDYIVAGLAVEAAAGRPVGELLRERVLAPAGLAHTYLDGDEPALPGLVRGYETDGETRVDATSAVDASAAWTAGALVSTTSDLTTFYAHLAAGALLAPAELREMTTWVPTGWPDEPGYGLGLGDRRSPLGAGWGHKGGIWGFISSSYALVERGDSITVLVNLETADVDRIADDLANVVSSARR
jgi:D-alanyl-D-alanine carboxypeptidase